MVTLTMNEITLRRTGDCPVRFRGKLVATASGEGQRDGRKSHLRWYEIALYRTEADRFQGERYAVHVAYRTRMDGEMGAGHDFVDFAAEIRQVLLILRRYNPIRVVVGHQTSGQRHYKADRLEQALRRSYDETVSDLAELIGVVDSPGSPGPAPYALADRGGNLLGSDGSWHPETFALGYRHLLLRFRTAGEAEAARRALVAVTPPGEDGEVGISVTTLP